MGQKKEEWRCKEIFGSCLSVELSLGYPLCGSSLRRGASGVVSLCLYVESACWCGGCRF
jgi:hypothetical protein